MATSEENMLLARSSSEVVVIVARGIILQLISSTKRNSLCLDSPTLGVSMDMVKIIGTPCVDHFERGTSFNVDRCVN